MANFDISPNLSKSKSFTYEDVSSSLRYDPETGIFYRVRTHARWRAGEVACGTVNTSGYRVHSIKRMPITAQRLAVMLMLGRWPAELVDHINQDKLDNRWCNLRECSFASNNSNRVWPIRNLPTGVQRSRETKRRFTAMISVDGNNKYLGSFDSPEDAHSAYARASRKLRGPFSAF
ncbi:MAG: HNH endonuclease [Mesorhizobium sp.]